MKSIANSQLTGKWYNIARTRNFFEMKFVEIFLYISIACENYLDLLYVGIKEDRSKVLWKLTLETLTKNDTFFIILKKGFFRKRFKILTFDDKNGILILSDKKMKYLSIFSRKPTMKQEIMESCLNRIEEMNGKMIELYSDSIV
jgi:lipocalin